MRRLLGSRIRMDSHIAEVMAEPRLKEGAGVRIERLSVRRQDPLHTVWNSSNSGLAVDHCSLNQRHAVKRRILRV
jgi:hypothetical protein